MIYLDNAATSFHKPIQVSEAIVRAMNQVGNSGRGTHHAAMNAAREIFMTRALISELFHGDGAEQVVFTSNSTQSLNIVIKGILNAGDVAVSTVLEHNSVLRPLYQMEKQGVTIKLIGADATGIPLYDQIQQAIKEKPALFICTHVSNLTGNKLDIERIGGWCRENGVLFALDASQSAGVFDIDMKKQNIDIVCFTGHKGLMGPQGTGGICIRKGVKIRPLLTGGSGNQTFSKEQPEKYPDALEAGTMNTHGLAGLKAALLYIKEIGISNIREKEQELSWYFYKKVKKIPGVRIYGNFESKDRAGIVALNIGDEDSARISDFLATEYEIYTRSGGHCAPLLHEHFGTVEQGAVRFSFSHDNTYEEADKAIEALCAYIKGESK